MQEIADNSVKSPSELVTMPESTKLRIKTPLYLAVMLGMLAFSCKEEIKFPDEPTIKLVSAVTSVEQNQLGTDVNRTVLTFSFTDGDGDIGLSEVQTAAPFDFNLFVIRIAIKDGVDQNPELLKFRIPVLKPSAGNTGIQGELDVQLDVISITFPEDSLRYELYLLDRALNSSNIISTSTISLQ